MVGVIRKRDILAHPFVTIRCFGWAVFFRTLVAGRPQTFLSVLVETRAVRPPTIEVPELLGRCIELELCAKRIYERLAERFADREPVKAFFQTLVCQEQSHAELLGLCREAASREGWLEEYFNPWRATVPRLEQQMHETEASLDTLSSAADALHLVIRVESSEIDQVFDSVVAATDSDFVRSLRAFDTAETEHLSYIADQIPALEPELASQCRELKAKCLSQK